MEICLKVSCHNLDSKSKSWLLELGWVRIFFFLQSMQAFPRSTEFSFFKLWIPKVGCRGPKFHKGIYSKTHLKKNRAMISHINILQNVAPRVGWAAIGVSYWNWPSSRYSEISRTFYLHVWTIIISFIYLLVTCISL